MTRIRLSILVALLCAAMLVLQGCGGNGDNGMEQDLQEQITVLEGQLSDAQAAAEVAETARMAAVEAQEIAEAAEAMADMERDAANVALGVANETKRVAEEAKAAAETAEAAARQAEADALAAQMNAETDRDTAMAAQYEAEMARDAADTARMAAEAAEADAIAARDMAVTAREAAEAAEAVAVAARETAEARRDMAIVNEVEAQHARDQALADLAAANIEVERLTGELGTANASVKDLQDMLAAANSNAEKLQADLDAANMRITQLEEQIGSKDDPESLQGMLDAANAEVAKLMGDLGTANDEIKRLTDELAIAAMARDDAEANLIVAVEDRVKAEQARDDAMAMLDDAEKRASDAEAALETAQQERDAAITRAEAAEAEVARLREEMRDDEDDTRDDERQAAMYTRAGSLASALIASTSFSGDLEVEYDGGPMVSLDDHEEDSANPPPAISGLHAVTLSRERAAPVSGTDSVYLYSDITSPQPMKFEDVYTLTDGMLGITSGGNGNSDKAMSPDFPDMIALYTHNPTVDGDAVDSDPIDGTYDGADGEFDCTGTCTILGAENDDDEIVLTFTGSWMFTPDDEEDTVMVADADHLTFGFWLYKPIEGEDTHFFAPIAMGMGDDSAYDATGVAGTATFRGNAAGKYVTRDTIAESAEIGIFTAKAKLEADFDDDNISGQITDFMSGGQELEGWMVMLDETTLGGGGDTIDDGTGDVSGTIAGITIATGTAGNDWSATFHGDADARMDDQPGSVVGMFDLHGGSETMVSVSGAFGAHNVSPDTAP